MTGEQIRNLKMALMILFLNVADVITTQLILDRGGIEGNPLMAPLFESSPAIPLLMKLAVSAFLIYLTTLYGEGKHFKTMFRMLTTVAAVYVAIVTWNLKNLLTLIGVW